MRMRGLFFLALFSCRRDPEKRGELCLRESKPNKRTVLTKMIVLTILTFKITIEGKRNSADFIKKTEGYYGKRVR